MSQEPEIMKNICILTSGLSRGSNFQAIAAYFADPAREVELSFVAVNRKKAPITERCRELGIPWLFLSTRDMENYGARLLSLITENRIDLVALAGFMKKLPPGFLRKCPVPVLNIHPALLPEFGGKGMYGMNVHRAVFEAGKRESGASVHFVTEGYDEGPLIAQQTVDIRDCGSPEQIAARVLAVEHHLYPRAIEKTLRQIEQERK